MTYLNAEKVSEGQTEGVSATCSVVSQNVCESTNLKFRARLFRLEPNSAG